jgi:hypothetical protein
MKMTRYSNPRMEAVVKDWPSGGKRVTATFRIETHPKRGQRGTRQTTGKVKTLTYCDQARLVDGDDGRIYIAEITFHYEFVHIRGGDLMTAETIFPDNPRYPEVQALFGAAGSALRARAQPSEENSAAGVA